MIYIHRIAGITSAFRSYFE